MTPLVVSVQAFWTRYGRHLTAAAVAVLLVVGVVLIRRYWLRVQNERARQELAEVIGLRDVPDAARLEHLERLERQYAGCEAGAEIRYRLGLAQRDAGRLDQAEQTFLRLERDFSGSDLSRMSVEARRATVEERNAQASVSARIRALDAEAKAQRAGGEGATAGAHDAGSIPPKTEPAKGPTAPPGTDVAPEKP